MSFRTRLSLFFVTIAVVPLVTVAALLLGLSADGQTGKADARVGQGLRTALALYQERARDARPQLERVLGDRAVGAALTGDDRAALRRRLRRLTSEPGAPASIAVYGRDGSLSASAGAAGTLAPATAAARGGGGRSLGMVAVSTTAATTYVRQVQRTTGLDTRVAGDGTLLASTVGEGDRAPLLSGDVQIAGRAFRGRAQQVQAPVGAAVAVGVYEPSAGLAQAIARTRTIVGAVVLALIAVGVLFATFIVRNFQRQIAQFLAGARRLRQGDFSRPVPIEGRDEFALLGIEFNKMSDQLSAKIEQVERQRQEAERNLRRLGEAFAAKLDAGTRLGLAVETALEVCAAAAARAVPQDASQMSESRAGSEEPALLEALARAESSALARRTQNGATAGALGRRPSPIVVDGVHAMAAPLVAGGGGGESHDLGVLSVARRGHAFDDSERDRLVNLAGQFAVGIENAHLHKAVELQSVTDELTGLNNVRQFHRMLHGEVERSRRFGGEVGLLMLDIDSFKAVNDTYGHQQGDLVLKRVARVLEELSRDIDQPARYGGEEMAMVLPETDLGGAEQLAERIRTGVEALVIERLDGQGTISVTASFGVSSMSESAIDKDSLIAAADAALYRAKRAGKNRVERAEPVPAKR